MAFNADILLDLITGPAEREVKKIERKLDRLDRKAGDIDVKFDVNDREIRRAERLLDNLERTRRVRLLVDERVRRSAGDGGGGGGGGDNSGAALFGGTLSNFATRRQRDFSEISKRAIELTKADEQLIALSKQYDAQLTKIAAKEEKLAAARRNLTQVNNGFANKGRSLAQSLNDVNNAVNRNEGDLKRYNDELEKLEKNLTQAAMSATERGTVQAANELSPGIRRDRRRRVLGAAGAGLALANVPGQDLFQAAGAGALIGGPKGAAIAAAVASLAKLASLAPGIARSSAEIAKLELALSNIAQTQTTAALDAIARAVDDFNTPVKDATANFTQLLAATQASGFSVAETEKVFRGLSAANKALGGDAQKLQGILLATTQVFSKGKVTAEELRGQIGERLPGAFAKFAEATGRTTAQLDKALEKGEVDLNDFVTFAAKLLDQYEEDAKKIATGPEEAGARLQVALDKLTRVAGPALADLGAKFQDFATTVINAITPVIEKLNEIFNIGQTKNLKAYQKALSDLAKLDATITRKETQLAGATDNAEKFALNADIASLTKRRDQLAARVIELGRTIPPNLPNDTTKPPKPEETEEPTDPRGGRTRVDNLEERIRLSEQALNLARADADVAQQVDALDRIRIEAYRDILELQFDLTNALEGETSEIVRGNIEAESRVRILERQLKMFQDLNAEAQGQFADFYSGEMDLQDAMKQAQDEFTEFFKDNQPEDLFGDAVEQAARRVGTAIEDGIVGSLDAAITGAKDLKDVLQEIASNLLLDIGRMFLRAGISGLGAAWNIPGFSNGGTIQPNSLAVVGENGPELVTNGPTPMQVFSNQQSRNAVEQMNAYTPGGMGPAGSHGPINVHTGPVVEFDGDKYVKMADFEIGLARAAKQGAQMGEMRTMTSLKNNRSARSRIGI